MSQNKEGLVHASGAETLPVDAQEGAPSGPVNWGEQWSKVRSMLSDFGERYRAATRYEEGSIIADGVARKITSHFQALAEGGPTPDGAPMRHGETDVTDRA